MIRTCRACAVSRWHAFEGTDMDPARTTRRLVRASCAVVALIAVCAAAGAARPTKEKPEVSSDEYEIYNAALNGMQFPKEDVHVLIFDQTLRFGCTKTSDNAISVNSCSFLAIAPDTPKQIMKLLRDSWPQVSKSTCDEFERQNGTSAKLRDSLVTSWKHRLVGGDIKDSGGSEWDSADFEVFFSRVGFDPQRTEAVVYVLLFSHVDQVQTGGDYFFFRRDKSNGWEMKGRVRYFEKDKIRSK